jgi:bifunctional DNA-binding transcriptional regulator/antitoxin component of YhaV-PrlF toxin-antitoxin module
MTVRIHRVTGGGQISLPADVRRRWRVDRVLVVDRGDHVIVRPAPENTIAALRGIWKDRRISTKELREIARQDEQHALARRERAARPK